MSNHRRKTATGIWINRNGKPITRTKSYLIDHADHNNKLVPTPRRKSRY